MRATLVIKTIILGLVVDEISNAYAKHREGKYKGTHWWWVTQHCSYYILLIIYYYILYIITNVPYSFA